MNRHQWSLLMAVTLVGAACRDVTPPSPVATSTGAAHLTMPGTSQVASMYALDFVGTVATGYSMNDAGDVVGKHYIDTGCGPFCLPPEELVVWRGGTRTALPLVPGFTVGSSWPFFMNNSGLIAGYVGTQGLTTHVAVWTPNGAGYTAQDLGVFPGATSADVYGLDDQGRMVGWSTKGGAIPTFAVPFMWSQGTGFVDLAALGYPNEVPGGMSPGGKVVTTSGHWYQLGNPASVVPLPPPPRGFSGFGRAMINDNGDQAHFLGTGTQGLIYPFRLSNGVWQQISGIPTGHLSSAGLGSINLALDISFTAGGIGMIAAGPAGVGQSLAALVSPAYPGAVVSGGGPMNNSRQILARVFIGRSPRLMKMTPVTPCVSNCLVVNSFVMVGRFVEDPQFPGSCFQGGKMYNTTTTTLTLTDETGAALSNAVVRGRYMDDYWTDLPVSGTTNAAGVVAFTHKGLCGVGAIAFLVEGATIGSRTLDRTRGTLGDYVIPSVGPPPPNLPPVAAWSVSCQPAPAHTCTFNGTASRDPDGTIVSYKWTNANGKVLSTQATFTKSFVRSASLAFTLTVTDNGGKTGALTQTIAIP